MSQTIDYPYCVFNFAEWNPVQEQCLPYFCQDKNLVVSASVAAGKTAIAEAIMGYELSFPSAKAVYLCPLKALSAEKYNEWKKHETFGEFQILILDSDHEVSPEELEKARLIIATVESMNIRCRRNESWIRKVRVLVFDEAHLFDHEKRGSCSESLMMDLTENNRECRLICLSGTLSNTREIALWCNRINGKPTPFIASNWRPTRLIKLVEPINELAQQFQFVEKKIKASRYEKVLIFVHSKRIGEMLKKHLRDSGIRCAFYSSDLDVGQREELLKKFRSGNTPLDVLIATSSLSQGVSL